ncbi:MAG TPA: hydantoinase/oxoprolinase family protein [Chloroflexota bacterium]
MDGRHEPILAIGVDTGGTFTDIFTSDGTVLKVPSTPHDLVQAIVDGLRRLGAGSNSAVAHGTTVATNTVLERKGACTALITTAGFADVLEIRRQNRPAIYDLSARWPQPLVPRERRLGAAERLDYRARVLSPLTDREATCLAERVASLGAESVAVCLLFAYANPVHEDVLCNTLRSVLGAEFPISVSHEVAPQYGEFERTSTTVVNAYVMPRMARYLRSLEAEVRTMGVTEFHVMHSNGGLARPEVAAERPVQTILSGPAAGVVGARAISERAGTDHIITVDMGGTSTDVAVVPGEILEGAEGEVSGFPLLLPMLTIETVGAGGGSIAWVDEGGGLHVGPMSAGADPGPAAYGRGDRPTVTDANLVLGRLSASGLLGGTMALEPARARQSLSSIAQALELSLEEAAWAVVRLANSNMERAVNTVTLQRGYDPRHFTLFPFGGAGPLHAAELATGLGIEEILVPPHPGIMAALGLTVPDLQRDYARTVLLPLQHAARGDLRRALNDLERVALADLRGESLFGDPLLLRAVDMRFVGQSFDLRVPFVDDADTLKERFEEQYRDRYGPRSASTAIEIVNVRLRAVLPRLKPSRLIPPWPEQKRAIAHRDVWYGSSVDVSGLTAAETAVYWRPSLKIGVEIQGPALLEQYDSTTLIPPGWTASVNDELNLRLVLERP